MDVDPPSGFHSFSHARVARDSPSSQRTEMMVCKWTKFADGGLSSIHAQLYETFPISLYLCRTTVVLIELEDPELYFRTRAAGTQCQRVLVQRQSFERGVI